MINELEFAKYSKDCWAASTPFGTYQLMKRDFGEYRGWWIVFFTGFSHSIGEKKNREDAEVLAQEHYTQRIALLDEPDNQLTVTLPQSKKYAELMYKVAAKYLEGK